MTASVSDFTTRFPKLASEGTPRIQMFLNDALQSINPEVIQPQAVFDLATLYLAAHLLVMDPDSTNFGVGRLVSQQSAGDLSRTYNVQQSPLDKTYLSLTHYGAKFLSLRTQCVVGMALTVYP